MYGKSVAVFINLLPIVGGVLGAEIVLQIIESMMKSTSSLMFVRTLIWSYLAYAAHAELLLSPDRDKTADNKRIFSFAWRSFGLSMLAVVPIVFVLFGIRPLAASINLSDKLAFAAIIVVVASISILLVFGLFGTILPAFVANYDRGIKAAFTRGLSQFSWTIGRLLVGPGAIMFAGSVLAVVAAIIVGGNSFLIAIIGVLTDTIFALATVMTAWVLSSAYKRCYGVAY